MNRPTEVNYFFSSPSWRWQRANYECDKSSKGETDYCACNDQIVRSAVRFLTLWKNQSLPKDRIRQVLPYYSKIVDIFGEISPGCSRFSLEAAILSRAEPEFIVGNMGFEIDPMMYRMYKQLFFDVEQQLDSVSKFWLEKHIFAPSRKYSKTLIASGYVWKKIAVLGGIQRLMDVGFTGATEAKTMEFLRDMSIKETAKSALNFAFDRDRIPVELDSVAKSSILGNWLVEEDKKIANLQNGAESANLNEIGALTTAVRPFSEKDKLGKVENVLSEKYTDKDLQI